MIIKDLYPFIAEYSIERAILGGLDGVPKKRR